MVVPPVPNCNARCPLPWDATGCQGWGQATLVRLSNQAESYYSVGVENRDDLVQLLENIQVVGQYHLAIVMCFHFIKHHGVLKAKDQHVVQHQ